MDNSVIVDEKAGVSYHQKSDNNCKWTGNYLKGEHMGCSDLRVYPLQNFDDKSEATCKEACKNLPECYDFVLGRAGTAQSGKCTLLKKGCPARIDNDLDFYNSRWLEFPSKKANVCTHKPPHSDS